MRAVTAHTVVCRAAAVVAAAALLPLSLLAGAPVAGARASSAVRTTGSVAAPPVAAAALVERVAPVGRSTDFDRGWRFVLANSAAATDPTGRYAGAAAPGYDDSRWQAVELPHDWSIGLAPRDSEATSSGTGFLPGGLGWYRKSFVLPRSAAGRQLSLEFDGVYTDSVVYLDGRQVAAHAYGYTGFAVDLTGRVHTDGVTRDVVAVQVRNQVPSSRWYSGSGIYRDVHLVSTDPVHVTRHGTTVTTPGLATTYGHGYADVAVRTDLVAAGPTPVTVRATVLDASGRSVGVAQSTLDATAAPVSTATRVRVTRPQLWSPGHPYLYDVRTQVISRGRVLDTVTTRTGLRWTVFDAQRGFSINGRTAKIQGVDLHADGGALGAAVNEDAIERQLRTMRAMGVNFVRTAHNPPAPALVAVADRLGMLLMVEAFDTWRTPKVTYDYGRSFDANSDADITEMVQAWKNSPAVVLWSIGNEIPDSTSEVGVPIATRLIADVRAVDATRPVVIGSDKYRSVPRAGSAADRILRLLDGVGLNYNSAQSVDALHAAYPSTFFFESESSSVTDSRDTYQDPDQLNTGEDYTPGHRATSSYDNNLASYTFSSEYALKKDRDRPWFLGEFLWSGTDYLGEPSPYDVFPVKSSFFGAVDTAGLRKDRFYLFQSQWTSTPMVHLLPSDWTGHRPGDPVTVWAYSNVDTVELLLDGRSLGVRRFDRKTAAGGRSYLETTEASGDDRTRSDGAFPGSYTSPNGSAGKLHLTWTVPFAPGTLTAVARRGGKVVASDTVRTAGAPYAVRLSPDRKVVAADGRALAYVTAEVVDRAGVVVPGAQDELRFSVAGATLAGADNGREESAEPFSSPVRAAFHGKAVAIVQAARRPGPATITAAATGLRTATATVWSTPTGPVAGSRRTVGVDPVDVRVPRGGAVVLPRTVDQVRGDGSVRVLAARWPSTPVLTGRVGRQVVTGRAGGRPVRAVVTVTTVRRLVPVTASVPVGVVPSLPGQVHAFYSDGTDARLRVSWATGPAARWSAAGRQQVTGRVSGTPLLARALVRVSSDVVPGTNLAAISGPVGARADASYSGRADSVPLGLIDGATADGGWSDAYVKAATPVLPAVSRARATDWVSVRWPEAQTVGQLNAYVVVDATRARPRAMAVSWWDGSRWRSVDNLVTAAPSTPDGPTTLRFDRVDTSEIRLTMASAAPGTPTGFLGLRELQAIGDLVR